MEKSWGISLAINLSGCDHDRLIDAKLLEQFVAELIRVIEMEAHGPCHIDRFGEGSLTGYSAIQFIKTSSISVHLDEVDNRAFIDIFSCKVFDSDKASQFSQDFFKAEQIKAVVLDR